MAFTGNEDQHISLEDAAKLTGTYRQSAGDGATLGGYFSRNSINLLFDQAACVGIRVYYGLTEDKKPQMVIVGVNAEGDDLYQGTILEHALTCPPFCSRPNQINS
jgi:hypothetical protein